MIFFAQHRIYRVDLRNNPNFLYIFGDNLERRGMGGQAKEMRGELNAFGIATKRRQTHGKKEDYFHDSDPTVRDIILAEFDTLHGVLKEGGYKAIVIPADGIGTGLARMTEFAPRSLTLINAKLLSIKDTYEQR